MIIKSINLTNFRNHENYHLECNQDTTLILGENGCGKTSVLEAIYILTRGKSFRSTDPEIIKRGTSFYRIELEYDNGEKIVASYDTKNKTFVALDKKSRRLPKKSRYPIVLFLPSDLNLVSGSPSRHREYFDRIFSQINEEYNTNLSRYEKALKQRNELLKNEYITKTDLFSWNLLLAKYGVSLYKTRKLLTDEINQNLENVYHSIAKNDDKVSLVYETEIINDSEEQYLNQLEKNYEKDKYLGHTSFGVHRDDYEFIFNNCEADGSASRGETRSIILALKFIEADIIFQKLNQKPIVLLDDVFSELDEARRKCLISNFKDHQVILTSVEAVE
ncbi:DNA replication and repair protein RecF [Candidatus Saccharibacteria bacterium]|nr:DNA replication and repair protein RecF [Candidatus Saccharibacteria bacterium]